MLSCLPDFKNDKPIQVVYQNANSEYCCIRAMERIEAARLATTKEVAQEELTRAIQLLLFCKEKAQ